MKKIPFNERYFSQDNEHVFYWAGFLAADGCIQDRIQTIRRKLKSGAVSESKTHIKEI